MSIHYLKTKDFWSSMIYSYIPNLFELYYYYLKEENFFQCIAIFIQSFDLQYKSPISLLSIFYDFRLNQENITFKINMTVFFDFIVFN